MARHPSRCGATPGIVIDFHSDAARRCAAAGNTPAAALFYSLVVACLRCATRPTPASRSALGELALLDGSPRSATCKAVSAVQAAGLSSRALELLIERHPKVAAKLLIGLGARIADRLRGLNDQLQMYAQMTGELQAEVARLRGDAAR